MKTAAGFGHSVEVKTLTMWHIQAVDRLLTDEIYFYSLVTYVYIELLSDTLKLWLAY